MNIESGKSTETKSAADPALPNCEGMESAKIFMIDDEPIVLELFEAYLTDAGFRNIFAFTDSVEAIETLRFVTPCIILTDINMPEVSGKFLIKLIRTFDHLRTVPIVAVTSITGREEQKSILRKGADSVMHKPVDDQMLTTKVIQTLESSYRLKHQITEAEERKHQLTNKKKAKMRTVESDLRDMLR